MSVSVPFQSQAALPGKMSDDASVPLGSITNRVNKRAADSMKAAHFSEMVNSNGTATLSRKSLLLQPCDNCLGQDEYIKSLQSALREVSEENEILRERVVELEAMLSQIDEDISDKDACIAQIQAGKRRLRDPACS